MWSARAINCQPASDSIAREDARGEDRLLQAGAGDQHVKVRRFARVHRVREKGEQPAAG